jgi:hypothetical protein
MNSRMSGDTVAFAVTLSCQSGGVRLIDDSNNREVALKNARDLASLLPLPPRGFRGAPGEAAQSMSDDALATVLDKYRQVQQHLIDVAQGLKQQAAEPPSATDAYDGSGRYIAALRAGRRSKASAKDDKKAPTKKKDTGSDDAAILTPSIQEEQTWRGLASHAAVALVALGRFWPNQQHLACADFDADESSYGGLLLRVAYFIHSELDKCSAHHTRNQLGGAFGASFAPWSSTTAGLQPVTGKDENDEGTGRPMTASPGIHRPVTTSPTSRSRPSTADPEGGFGPGGSDEEGERPRTAAEAEASMGFLPQFFTVVVTGIYQCMHPLCVLAQAIESDKRTIGWPERAFAAVHPPTDRRPGILTSLARAGGELSNNN